MDICRTFYRDMKCWNVYFLSLIILILGFFVNIKISKMIVISSIVLSLIFIVINIIKEFIDHHILKIKKNIWEKYYILYLFSYILYVCIYIICNFLYHDFIFGELKFSLNIFGYILLLHFFILLSLFLDFLSIHKKQKTQQ